MTSLRILIVDTYYPGFLAEFYAARPDAAQAPYRTQWRALMDAGFGTSDFYSRNLARLGHHAEEVVVNCVPLQRQWAREHQPALLRRLPLHRAMGQTAGWLTQVLAAQVEKLRPDVLYIQDLNQMDPVLLRHVRPGVRLVVGQTACPLEPDVDLEVYDLLLTSFPHYVAMFRGQGMRSEYFRIGFESSLLDRLGPAAATHDVSFVGGFTPAHRSGTRLLEAVAAEVPIWCWGYGGESLAEGSPLRRHYGGAAWGLAMYRVLAASRITLNRHIDVAGRFANNMRLFEATGVGTLLVTDAKENLASLFEPGKEVVVYRDAAECAALLRYYLDHEPERAAIAKAGQARTLTEHTYARRMDELSTILCRLISQVGPKRTRPAARGASPGQLRFGPILQRIPGGRMIRPVLRRVRRSLPTEQRVSDGHRLIAAADVTHGQREGWKDPSIPARQRRLVDRQLLRMYQGDVVPVFRVAAEAVASTGAAAGSIVEVGCASGYYAEVLSHLLNRPVRYVGLDYSMPLVALGRQRYSGVPFVVGDATRLPLVDGACDVLFSGTVLLHVPEYPRVIEESVRVARTWCIFHRTPVFHSRETTFLSKYAYGTGVVEVVFNEGELLRLFDTEGLEVTGVLEVETYALPELSEAVRMQTYVCRKRARLCPPAFGGRTVPSAGRRS